MMILIGGQRSLTAAARRSPSMEPGILTFSRLKNCDGFVGVGRGNHPVTGISQNLA
jgi:hypothetical protein